MFDDLPLSQNQKWSYIWIQHIITVVKHSVAVIHILTHTRNNFPSNFTAMTKWWLKKHLLFYVWWSSTKPKLKMIWYLDSAHQNSWKTLLWSHSLETIFQPTLQQWRNDGSSNKNTYYFMFNDFPLNQKQKWFDIWIQHMKTVGKHSLSVIQKLSHTRN